MIDVWPLQQAIYAALRATPATYPVYDAVPQGAAKPYIVIGEWTAEPDEEIDAASVDASVQIHGWSGHVTGAAAQLVGQKEAHAILQFIRARLDNQTVAGAWACSEEFETVNEDPKSTNDARIYHGVARYRIRAN